MKALLSILLHLANRSVPTLGREEFYKIKTLILKRHGKFIGYDMQHIVKKCYSCNGTGIFKSDWKLPETCWSCGGSGNYKDFWSKLEKYKLGKYYFHHPIERFELYQPLFDGNYPVINGLIRHKTPKYYLADEAAYWLFLFYDWKTFKRVFGKSGQVSKKFTPMVILGTWLFNIRMFDWRYVKVKRCRIEYDDQPF